MKIDKPTGTDNLNKVAGKKKTQAQEGTGRSFKTDLNKASGDQTPVAQTGVKTVPPAAMGAKGAAVSLGLMSQSIDEATKLVAQSPEVREKLVAELKGKIERGEYKIDSRKVADKMIRSGFIDILIKPI